jgi:predicted RNA polymerase sigma factor
MLAGLVPAQREVHGLVALLELQASRLRARTDAAGNPILLLDQDRARWDWLLVNRGFAALAMAQQQPGQPGPYELQAAIAACHASARTAAATDWQGIVRIYDALARVQPSPVVRLNRAVAVGMADGPAAALPLVEAIAAEGSLAEYHPLPAVLGDLLQKLGRRVEAREQFGRAAALAQNQRERALLLERARATLD